MQYTYETIGNSSYLVATFKGGETIINYQLSMLANNTIKGLLKASRNQKNDDVMILYNITSRISLAQAEKKKKIKKDELITIIEGAIETLENIEAYQLVSTGIVFDEDYIFVKSGSFEPAFVYAPVYAEENGIEGLKSFLLKLFMTNKVEMISDNFIQRFIEILDSPTLTLTELKKACSRMKKMSETDEPPKRGETNRTGVRTTINPIPQPHTGVGTDTREGVSIPKVPGSSTAIKSQMPQDKKAKDKKEKGNKKSKMPMFLLFQVLLAAAVVAIVFSGVLTAADGSVEMTYLGGVLLGVACVDFVLYRELFVNKKNKEVKDEAPKKNQKSKSVQTPGKMASIPGKDNPMSSKTYESRDNSAPVKMPGVPEASEPQKPLEPIGQPQFTQASYIPPAQTYNKASGYGYDQEDTVVLDDENATEVYLEYFDNGLVTKIKIVKESTIIGKLRGQCDYILNNNKISKVHAEVISRNGEYYIKDYNSTNGTYLNGASQRIQSNVEYRIYNRDRITLANIDLTFRC